MIKTKQNHCSQPSVSQSLGIFIMEFALLTFFSFSKLCVNMNNDSIEISHTIDLDRFDTFPRITPMVLESGRNFGSEPYQSERWSPFWSSDLPFFANQNINHFLDKDTSVVYYGTRDKHDPQNPWQASRRWMDGWMDGWTFNEPVRKTLHDLVNSER